MLTHAYDSSEVIEIDFNALPGKSMTNKFQEIYGAILAISEDRFKTNKKFAILNPALTTMLELSIGKRTTPFFENGENIWDDATEIKFFGSVLGPRYIGKTIDGLHLYENALAPQCTIMLGDNTRNENGENIFIRVNIKNFVV
jgi:hypothetical protein